MFVAHNNKKNEKKEKKKEEKRREKRKRGKRRKRLETQIFLPKSSFKHTEVNHDHRSQLTISPVV